MPFFVDYIAHCTMIFYINILANGSKCFKQDKIFYLPDGFGDILCTKKTWLPSLYRFYHHPIKYDSGRDRDQASQNTPLDEETVDFGHIMCFGFYG